MAPASAQPARGEGAARKLRDDALVFDPLCGERKLSSYERIYGIRIFREMHLS